MEHLFFKSSFVVKIPPFGSCKTLNGMLEPHPKKPKTTVNIELYGGFLAFALMAGGE